MANLFDESSLVMIPSGTKTSKVYSVKPDSGDGDFDFSRNSTATRINSAGLVEEVGIDYPRLQYASGGGGCASLLLEPSRTNLSLYSETFDESWWSYVAVTNNGTVTAPDGTNSAIHFVEVVEDNFHQFRRAGTMTGLTTGENYILSLFFKGDGSGRNLYIEETGTLLFEPFSFIMDDSGNVVSSGGEIQNIQIEPFADDWYRVSFKIVCRLDSASAFVRNGLADGTTTSYLGDGVSGGYFWGYDIQQGTYPTTYIPTGAATVNRGVEDVTLDGLQNSILGANEGTFYFEYSQYNDTQASFNSLMRIYLDAQNYITFIARPGLDNTLRVAQYLSNVPVADYTRTNASSYSKWAVRWNGTTFDIFIDGINIFTDTSAGASAYTDFRIFSTSNTLFAVDELQMYPTPLTDEEMIALTS